MYKTLEATIDTQGKIHWQEQPPIQGQCRVLITLLDEVTDKPANLAPRQPGLLKGTLGNAFFEPLSEEELKTWES